MSHPYSHPARLGRHLLLLGLLLSGPAAWAQLSGTYYVGTSPSPDAARTYPTLPDAVAALGAGIGGPVTLQLLDASYSLTGALTVPAIGGSSATNTVRVVPAAGVTPLITGSVATGLLVLDGTDYFSLDGSNGSSAARTITVRNTANGPAVVLRNDATYNGLRYLTLESANTGGNSGTVLFGTTTGSTGNDFNTLLGCDVRELGVAPGTVPANAIYSLGTGAASGGVPAATANSDNAVQDCNIYNFTAGGVFLSDTGSGGNWLISGNQLYQTATRAAAGIRTIRVTFGSGHAVRNNHIYQTAGTTASVFYGIVVANGASGVEVSGNSIGGAAPGATGAAMAFTGTAVVYPIFLSVGTTAPCSVQGNTIRNISSASTGVLYGVDLQNGAAVIGTVTPNTFGGTGSGQGLAAAGPLYAIQVENAATATIQNNSFGGLSTTAGLLTAVYLSGNGASAVAANTITGLSSNLTTAAQLAGIQSTGSGAVSLTDNVISNLSQSGLTSNLYGIQNNFTAGSNVTGNQVSNVTYSGTSTGNTVYGIWAGGNSTIAGNQVTTVQATGTSKANLRGIYVGGTGAAPTVTGNQVTGVLNSTTGSDVQSIGIFVGPTSGVMGAATVRDNRIGNVGTVNGAATGSTNVVTGLQCGALGAGSVVERNRVGNVYGGSAGTGANADRVRALAVLGASAATFANNQLSLAAGTSTQLSYGILDLSTGGTNAYYYNSVYLPPAPAAAASSYAFWRSATATPAAVELRNNLLYNGRPAATGSAAYALGTASTTNWPAASSNYNLLISPAAAAVGDWAGTGLNFAGWNVPSVNLLGAVDDGNGRWAEGYWWDALHPNDRGHAEMSYALVPSLLDALNANKPLPARRSSAGITLRNGATTPAPLIRLTPEEVVHPFTTTVRFRTSGSGRLVEVQDSAGLSAGTVRIDSNGKLVYQSAKGRTITGSVTVNDNRWHQLLLTHYYARGATQLYVDSVREGTVQERLRPTRLDLGGNQAPARVQLRDWLFYRSGMNQDEIWALAADSLLKSSLELYAPLDGRRVVSTDSLVNLAQSLNTLSRVSSPLAVRESAHSALVSLYPNPSTGELRLQAPLRLEGRPVTLYDLAGRRVLTTTVRNNRLSVAQLPAGVYSLVLQLDGETIHKRLVKQDR
ncbi:T9SS type A sorting domain-containing protein [Hymenobacter gummosus]|uniref:T9SS type A sorting domain-containing protein n=1 Tax=Hymenobacter gummosus TaxID=1776032 RepID=A0A431U2T2_9BACT|nr:T9SS type A sorting domain-containing protein [Hymenobacter gummosus]RTQ49688.1 T9SS type A sorting domain-containing protein [Hymenobacter gummosus]